MTYLRGGHVTRNSRAQMDIRVYFAVAVAATVGAAGQPITTELLRACVGDGHGLADPCLGTGCANRNETHGGMCMTPSLLKDCILRDADWGAFVAYVSSVIDAGEHTYQSVCVHVSSPLLTTKPDDAVWPSVVTTVDVVYPSVSPSAESTRPPPPNASVMSPVASLTAARTAYDIPTSTAAPAAAPTAARTAYDIPPSTAAPVAAPTATLWRTSVAPDTSTGGNNRGTGVIVVAGGLSVVVLVLMLSVCAGWYGFVGCKKT